MGGLVKILMAVAGVLGLTYMLTRESESVIDDSKEQGKDRSKEDEFTPHNW